MTITVLGVAASVATSGGMGDRSRDEMRARRAAQSWLYDIQSRPFATVGYTMHRVAFNVVGLTPVGDDPDGRVGEIIFSDGPLPDSYFVDVRVRWENRSGQREIRSRVVLANIMGDSGRTPSMSDLEIAAQTRADAPMLLREVIEKGEVRVNGDPSAKWADPLSLALDHLREAELLLGTTPVDIEAVVGQLGTALDQVEVALASNMESSLAELMIQNITTVITGLGGA